MDLNLAYWIQDLCYQAKAKQLPNSSEPTSWKQQLIQAGVFYFIPLQEIPTGRRLLKSRLVLRVKKDQQNNPIKFKARLVAKGFMQIEGLDYLETFATTSIPPTWRILLALAAQNSWYVEQIDFIGAFLNSELPEVNYLEIPEGLEAFISLNKTNNLAKLLAKLGYNPAVKQGILLKKALYGLKQGPREWQEALAKLLQQYGYSPLVSDPAIYYNSTTSTYIVSHVDDCLLTGPNLTYINKLKQQLHKVYPIEDRGQAAFFLGVQISRTTKGITLSQKGYIEEALSRFGLKEAKAVAIPLQPGVLKQATATPLTPLSATDQLVYQQIVGTLMYLMLLTRPDIAFAIQWLSRYMHQATSLQLSAGKNLLRYLKGTIDLAICYWSKLTTPNLSGYSDSDFAGDLDSSKSTYGYLFTLAGGPICWKSKRASTIALSTVEAESDALLEAIRELKWLDGLFTEIDKGLKKPIPLLCDNNGSISNANNPNQHNRTKHILLKFRYIRQEATNGLAKISYLNTKSMPADGLTKALTANLFQRYLGLLGLQGIPI
ncbi:hypothetical protein DCS_00089 [Drechmeria coniospora]|uniref:Reverse transcriptase Ty1/copia-type domain-containing protein n=1 Tax=Drechmeria coniospora TaxID=98403 RepID=A0A151GPN2_DRECN|nr:hypothetical protein DCS_00089 [Drechmeria coniospora]KYK58962.1 hypothetical protein DCS_00089 [Drechmeria coniospora]